MLEGYGDVLTIEDLQKILKVGRDSAYAAIKSGDIPRIKLGRKIRVSKAALMEVLNGKGVATQ